MTDWVTRYLAHPCPDCGAAAGEQCNKPPPSADVLNAAAKLGVVVKEAIKVWCHGRAQLEVDRLRDERFSNKN
jgi:hypothetical protein